MSLTGPTLVIVNPRSANGKTARIWPGIERRLISAIGPFSTRWTEAPDHAVTLASDGVREGFQTIIAVGGDGTISETANGLLDAKEQHQTKDRSVTLGVLPHGTGSDLGRSLGIPRSLSAAIDVLGREHIETIDAGRIGYKHQDGTRKQRWFCNLTSFGLGGAVAARAAASSKALGGKLTFMLATAQTLLRFKNQVVELTLDGAPLPPARILHVGIGNGGWHGGGMWVCPRADPADGWLDVTVIGDASVGQVLWHNRLLYNGKIYEHRDVDFYRVRRLSATSKENVLIEIDGEPLGRLPIEVEVKPGALRVITGNK